VRGKPIDRAEIHQHLWEQSDRNHRLIIHQSEFALFLEITQPTANRLMRDLVHQGRIRKIGTRSRNVGMYLVRDPKDFVEEGQ